MRADIKNTLIRLFSTVAVFLFFSEKALAVCPLCTVAVGAGIGLSRWLGIDDAITGLWLGGLIVSLIIWTLTWLEKAGIRFKGRTPVVIAGYYLLIAVSLYFTRVVGNPLNALYGYPFLDKLLLGMLAGTFGFWFGASWHNKLKQKNNGRSYFPFQKVVMPILPLIVLTAIFHYLLV